MSDNNALIRLEDLSPSLRHELEEYLADLRLHTPGATLTDAATIALHLGVGTLSARTLGDKLTQGDLKK